MKASKLKIFGLIALVLISMVAVSGIVNADDVPATIEKVYINGRAVDANETRGGITRGEPIEIEVKLLATGDDKYITVEATIEGLDHDEDKATDKTKTFSIKTGKTYYETLNIELPERMDLDDNGYALRIEVSNRKDDEVLYNAMILVDSERNSMRIKDVIFSPAHEVKAGRALLTTVRIKNTGEDKEEGVKVTVSIPELGLSASDYLDEVEEEDSVTSEELYLRIPECMGVGDYKAVVTVEFDEGDEEVSQEYTIHVVEDDTCNRVESEGKTIITVSSDVQDVTAGESGVVYPVTLTNTGSVAKTFSISSVAGDWADVKVSPSVVVLGAGETKIVYVSVAANEDASAGTQTFGIAVKSGDSTLKEVTLQANVLEGSTGWNKVRRGLEVALVVLVVLLVVIGLIIGFNRLKGDEDEEGNEETYY